MEFVPTSSTVSAAAFSETVDALLLNAPSLESFRFAGGVYPHLPEEMSEILEHRVAAVKLPGARRDAFRCKLAFFSSARENGMHRPTPGLSWRIGEMNISGSAVVETLSAILFAWGDVLEKEEIDEAVRAISRRFELGDAEADIAAPLVFFAGIDLDDGGRILRNPLYANRFESCLEEISKSYVKRFGAAMPRDGMPEGVRNVFTESVLSADFKTFLGMNLSFFSKSAFTPEQKKRFAERIEECAERFGEVAEFVSADPRNNHGAALVEFLFDNKELFGNHRSTCAGILKTYRESDVDGSAFAKEFFSIAFRDEFAARDFGKILGEDEFFASSGSRTAAFLNETGEALLLTDSARRTFLRSECVILSSFLEAASSSGYALENVLEKELLSSHNNRIPYNGILVLAVYDKMTGGSVFGERSESFFVFVSNQYAFWKNPESVWKEAFEKLVNSNIVLEFDAAEFCALALEKIGAKRSGRPRRTPMRLDIWNSPEAVMFAGHLAAAISSESDLERQRTITSFLKTCGKMLLEHDETKDAIARGLASGRGLEAADVVL